MPMVIVNGQTTKQVICENCAHAYEYPLKRLAVGTSNRFALTSAEVNARAEADAAEQLKRELAVGCNIVPCPKCGALTEEMKRTDRAMLPGFLKLMCLGGLILAGTCAFGVWTGYWYIIIILLGALLFFGSGLMALVVAWERLFGGPTPSPSARHEK